MGTSNKRQKREDYRRAQESLKHNQNATGLGGGKVELPKKKFYRQRAHANPFSDHALTYPSSPAEMDWTTHYPAFTAPDSPNNPTRKLIKEVEVADIGCGFGGLLVALSPVFPETLMIGMELRTQVTDYVINRIAALRAQHQNQQPQIQAPTQVPLEQQPQPSKPISTSSPPPAPTNEQTLSIPPQPPQQSQSSPGPYQNISALRSNTMKFLPNYFRRHQLSSIFLCFPDPHFKQRKHKARIVSSQLNAEYAFVLRPGGKVYTITDVEELHLWIVRHFEGGSGTVEGEAGDGEGDAEDGGRKGNGSGNGGCERVSELFERVTGDELEMDPCVRIMREETEEGKKVTRNGGLKFVGVWRRKPDPDWV